MKLSALIPSILLLLVQTITVCAQDAPATKATTKVEEKEKEKALLYSLGLDFGTGKTYKGRLSTPEKQRYLSPYLSVISRWGIFANASSYNLLGDSIGWDQSDIGLGYAKTIFKKYKLSVSYTHTFFNKNSEQVNSALSENLNFYVKRPLFKVLRTKLAFDYSFGDTTDFSITWQNSCPVYWDDVFTDDDEISWIPKFYLYFGTQNYLANFYNLPKAQRLLQKKGVVIKKPTPQEAQTDARFNLTGLYFSMPLSYTIGKFYFEVSPNYSITVNQPKYEPKTPNTLSFVFTIGLDF